MNTYKKLTENDKKAFEQDGYVISRSLYSREEADLLLNSYLRGYLSFLGDAYYYCSNIDNAQDCYFKSNVLSENGYAFFGLGTIEHYVFKDLTKAEIYYNKSSEYMDTKCDAKTSLAWLNYDKGNIDKAESYFKEVLELCKVQENYNEIISFYIKTGNLKSAKEYVFLSEEIFSSNYFTEGFNLIIDVIGGRIEISTQNNKIDTYYNTFGEEAANWLNSMSANLRNDSKIGVFPDTLGKPSS